MEPHTKIKVECSFCQKETLEMKLDARSYWRALPLVRSFIVVSTTCIIASRKPSSPFLKSSFRSFSTSFGHAM
jgi:hypothetical protein